MTFLCSDEYHKTLPHLTADQQRRAMFTQVVDDGGEWVEDTLCRGCRRVLASRPITMPPLQEPRR